MQNTTATYNFTNVFNIVQPNWIRNEMEFLLQYAKCPLDGFPASLLPSRELQELEMDSRSELREDIYYQQANRTC